jgi:hypothetical protein
MNKSGVLLETTLRKTATTTSHMFLTTFVLPAAAILLTACSAMQQLLGAGSSAGSVPWIDTPGKPMAAPASITAQRPCSSNDLRIQVGPPGAYEGHVAQQLSIKNVAADACFLAGPPLGSAVLPDGSQRSVTTTPVAAHRVDLAAGQVARVTLGTPPVCAGVGHPKVASQLRLSIGTVLGTWINVECGPPVVLLFTADPLPPALMPQSSLRARFTVPSSASKGTTLEYEVILSNPTNGAITLDPCPSYTQWLGMPPQVLHQTLLLNCLSRTIQARQSVAFQMRMSIPGSFPSGFTKLGWDLEVPNGPAIGYQLAVN